MIAKTAGLAVLLLTWIIGPTAQGGYWIDNNARVEKTVFTPSTFANIAQSSCRQRYANGVVRSWYLHEINSADFRRSYHYCRNMGSDGRLESSYERNDHFSYSGSGTKGSSSIPTSKLPVGVRLWKKGGNSSFMPNEKLTDVSLLYHDASKIILNDSGYSRASYALGRTGRVESTAYCGDGYVLTGLSVHHKSGGSNRREIVGLGITCSRLHKN